MEKEIRSERDAVAGVVAVDGISGRPSGRQRRNSLFLFLVFLVRWFDTDEALFIWLGSSFPLPSFRSLLLLYFVL